MWFSWKHLSILISCSFFRWFECCPWLAVCLPRTILFHQILICNNKLVFQLVILCTASEIPSCIPRVSTHKHTHIVWSFPILLLTLASFRRFFRCLLVHFDAEMRPSLCIYVYVVVNDAIVKKQSPFSLGGMWNKVTTRWEGPQSLSYHKYSLSKDGLLYTDSCVNKFV